MSVVITQYFADINTLIETGDRFVADTLYHKQGSYKLEAPSCLASAEHRQAEREQHAVSCDFGLHDRGSYSAMRSIRHHCNRY
jgi:hypothetical protein